MDNILNYSGIPVIIADHIPDDKVVYNRAINKYYVHTHTYYKFVFMSGVDDESIDMCINAAKDRVHKAIEKH